MCGLRLNCQSIYHIVAAGLAEIIKQLLTCSLDSP